MDALLIDPFDFCRRNSLREGQMAVAELDRLADAVADRSGTLDWHLSGGKGKLGRPQLTLSVKGTVQLICQRCLSPLAYEINTESRLIVAKDEEGADEIEEMLNDDTFDVIVGSSPLDIVALVEDEALLALPLSPRHEVCPDSSLLEEKSKKESPFSVLQGLKK